MKGVCPYPFEIVQIISTGEVIPCVCADYTDYSFGNIFEQTLDEIWNGEKARLFRQTILDRKYSFCKTNICSFNPENELNEINIDLIVPYPKVVHFSHDSVCNASCITCRHDLVLKNENNLGKLNELIDSKFIPFLKNAQLVCMNGSGEAFASVHSRLLIKKIIEVYPNIKFSIFTNGILCNEDNIRELGLDGRISDVYISIPASTKKTYDKIVKYGNFKNVCDNIVSLVKKRGEGKISRIYFIFVLNSLYYKEAKSVLAFAKKLAIPVSIVEIRDRNSSPVSDNFDQFAVYKNSHPKNSSLVKELLDPIFEDPCCRLSSVLNHLKESSF